MDTRTLNEHYGDIINHLINDEESLNYIKESDAVILALSSEAEKKKGDKLVFGQCEKVAEKYKWGIPCDFTITVFEPNVEDFTEEQIKILLFHELLHVGIDGDKYYIVPHDLEDFSEIISRYGVDWAQTNRS